ncbi:RNA-binding domain-containing protein [Sanguibacter sp. 25GB23B1]|uniref:ATP-binding protein n=1 Tax=unclassified Sanguibacter TaxID=2645534 RepID=UPI0032AE842A
MAEFFSLDSANRVLEPEGKTREYKRDFSSPDGLTKSIVAFANSAGGQLVVGVEDDRSIVGVDDPLAAEERVTSLIADRIAPLLVPGIDIVTVGEHSLLIVDVPLSTQRPHYVKRRGIEQGAYVRLGSTNRQADAALVAELERTARGIAFEDLPEPRASLDDLDLDALSKIRKRPTTREDLVPLGLAVRDGRRTVPTNAGLLVAGAQPDWFIPSAWVQCGRLRGPNGTDIFDQIEVHGPVPLAVDHVMNFLLKHAYKTAVFGEVRRRDVYSIPVEAIREVVVNALVHASYAERGTPIRVGFYDDRIQVDSPGLLLSGMTIESMRRASRLRNPSLVRIFREAGIMEQWGTGVQRVYDQVAAAGLPEPVIEEVMDRVRFTVFVGSHAPEAMLDADPRHQERSRDHQAGSSSHQVESPSEQGVQLLTVLGVQDLSRSELLGALGLRNETRNVRRHIDPLLEAGLVERTIPDRPRSSLQRYRITDLGRATLAQQEGTS